MKQTTKRFLSLIISFVLFTGTLIVYFNLVVPANSDQQTIKAQAISRQSFVDSQKAAISQIQKLINSYKGEGQLQDVVSSILPQSPDLAGAFSQVNGLIQVNNLFMNAASVNISPGKNISGIANSSSSQSFVKPVGSVDFQVKMTGTYKDFKSFLKNIETNIRIFDVKKVYIQPAVTAEKSSQDVYIYDVTITAYYQNNL